MDEEEKIVAAVEDKTPIASGEKPENQESEAKEIMIPYSRFSHYVKTAREAERENDRLRSQLEDYRQGHAERSDYRSLPNDPNEVPPEFQALFGNVNDPENGQKVKDLWKLEQSRIYDIERRTEEAAERAVERREAVRNQKYEANLRAIEDEQTAFEEALGRKLTKVEEEGVMTVLDEFSPQDEGGIDYLIPFHKAFDIYEMSKGKNKEGQKRIAGLSSSPSSGPTSPNPETKNPGFNRQDFGNWRKDPRLTQSQ